LECCQVVSESNLEPAGQADRSADDGLSAAGFVDVFWAERGLLSKIIAGMGLGGADAEDVLQDVSVKALANSAEYRDSQQAVGWLIKVTVNGCIGEQRRRNRFRRKAGEILKRRRQRQESAAGPDEKVIRTEELEIVRKTLKKLDDSLLTPVVLRYFCGLNSGQIGRVLDLGDSTVRSRLRQGRMILARQLIERGIEP